MHAGHLISTRKCLQKAKQASHVKQHTFSSFKLNAGGPNQDGERSHMCSGTAGNRPVHNPVRLHTSCGHNALSKHNGNTEMSRR